MNVRCHAFIRRGTSIWRVEVDRPQSEGGPFAHEFKGVEAVYYASQMASRWKGYSKKPRKTVNTEKWLDRNGYL